MAVLGRGAIRHGPERDGGWRVQHRRPSLTPM
jgi:hypothetical protein